MQVEEQLQEKLNSITHSPYYGCTVRVVSKAGVSYEGLLDGISTNKDRIFIKDVRVNANVTVVPKRNSPIDDANKNSVSDTLNAVMIDHLTNDIRTYEQVCLNVGDIQELRLIQLPSTFHESKAKLRAIDPCLVDIRLSPSDEYETRSNRSKNDLPPRAPIARQKRGESCGSNGDSPLISSSSNDSSSSFGNRTGEKFADESNDDSIDEQVEKLSELTTTSFSSKPVTLLAKKVLPKKIERRTNAPSASSDLRPTFSDGHETLQESTRVNHHNTIKKVPTMNQNRGLSPIRVTITSKLNPDAIPFFTQQRNLPAMQNPSFTFYERPRFRPRLQPVVSPDRSQSMPYGINAMVNNHQQPPPLPQQTYHHSRQRFVPPRQMAIQKKFTTMQPTRTDVRTIRTPPPTAKYRIHPSACLDKRSYHHQQQQQQQKNKTSNNDQFPGFVRQTSLPSSNRLIPTPPMQQGLSTLRNHPTRQSTASIRSTVSLPYQYGNSVDRNPMQIRTSSFGEPIGSRRNQRTFSGASSCSSLSVDIGPHSIVQLESSSLSVLPSFDEQYDFEKANDEFRRYLELEQLVTRRTSSHGLTGSGPDDHSAQPSPPQQQQQQQQSSGHSYKKEVSFFDRISCTATTGTAVGYTEMDETEKNLETFGDDALLMVSNSTDNEWQL